MNDSKEFLPCKLGDIADIFCGVQFLTSKIQPVAKEDGTCEVVYVSDLKNGGISKRNLKSFSLDKDRVSKFALKKGDVLISCKFTTLTVARVDFEPGERLVPYSNLLVVRPVPDKVNGDWLYYVLSDKKTKEKISLLGTGTGIKMLSAKNLSALELSMLSLDEQERAVKMLNRYNKLLVELGTKERRIKTDIAKMVRANML